MPNPQSFLDAVSERVVIYDGAFGTYVQALDLGPDDFGGPDLEGCNEHLVLTRPDVIAGCPCRPRSPSRRRGECWSGPR